MRLWFLWTLAASQLAGWKELRDDRGRTYYLNQRTGQTSWHPIIPPRLQGSCSSACEHQSCGDWMVDKAGSFYTVSKGVACDLGHIAMLKACPRSCAKCLVKDTACGKSDLLFNCKDGHLMSQWKEKKLRWCCKHRGIGCGMHQELPPAFDCNRGLANAWSKSKRAWCCKLENKGCRFNCRWKLDSWEHSWSLPKRAWCCAREKLGCIKPKEFECTEGVLDASHWSEVKRHYCCHMEKVGCTGPTEPPRQEANITGPKSYVCTGRDWPLDKIKWCCLKKKVGCKMLAATTSTTTMPELFDCQAGVKSWQLGWSHRKKVWCCKAKHIACPYDCRDHLSSWQVSWSAPQKTFCCATFRVGCVSLGLRPQPQPGHYDCSTRSELWSVWQQRWCCRNRGMGCEPLALPFGPGPKEVTKVETLDCSVGGSWTEAQRRICCADHGVGCLEGPVAPVAPVAHVVTRVEEVPASHVFSAAAYHCHAGSEDQWSNSKRHFCCKVHKVGCDFHSVLGSFDCNTYDAHWETTWSSEQKRICCHHYGIGCPHWQPPQLPARMAQDVHFDCSQAVVELWSVAQRAYCCAVEARGCSDRAAPSYDCRAGGPWRPAQRRWCCEEKNVGCETVALKFDCGKGIRDWRQAWSYQKQHFCCESVKVGCRKTRPWLQKLLEPVKETTSTTTVAYDCKAGVKHWKEGWSERKASWCCAQLGYGCPYECKGSRSHWRPEQHRWCCDHQGVACVIAKYERLGPVARGLDLSLLPLAGLIVLSVVFVLSLARWRERHLPAE